jgi:hypothetical protein
MHGVDGWMDGWMDGCAWVDKDNFEFPIIPNK